VEKVACRIRRVIKKKAKKKEKEECRGK